MHRIIFNLFAFSFLHCVALTAQDDVKNVNAAVSVPAKDQSGREFGTWVGKKINEKLEGECKLISNEGRVLAVEKYVDGKMHGTRLSYYRNGNIFEEASYVKGQRHGLVKRYYPNGSVAKQVIFVRDKVHGEVRKFYQNGKVCVEGMLEMGIPVGNFATYLDTGELVQVEDHKDGKILDKKVHAEPTPEQREKIRKVDEFSIVNENDIWGLSSKVESVEPSAHQE
jgi:hypothetical protein